jgi:hypothetical protein
MKNSNRQSSDYFFVHRMQSGRRLLKSERFAILHQVMKIAHSHKYVEER